MRALTVWQPYATAILQHGKDIENRPWKPPVDLYGKRIAIHAGLRIDRAALAEAADAGYPLPDTIPTGVLLGVVRLVGAHHADTCRCGCSPWADADRWHWELADPRLLPTPVPCRGLQRLWTVPPGIAAPRTTSAA